MLQQIINKQEKLARKNKNHCAEQKFVERDAIDYLKGLALNINFHAGCFNEMITSC